MGNKDFPHFQALYNTAFAIGQRRKAPGRTVAKLSQTIKNQFHWDITYLTGAASSFPLRCDVRGDGADRRGREYVEDI